MNSNQRALCSLLVLSLLATGCGTGEKRETPDPQRSYLEKIWAVQIPVVQCLVNGDLIPKRDLDGQKWLKAGTVTPGIEFNSWYSSHQLNKYGAKSLEDSVWDAAQIGPNHDCDSLLNAPPAG